MQSKLKICVFLIAVLYRVGATAFSFSKCKNGEEVTDYFFCDGEPDCADGSDEGAICTCGNDSETFRCTSVIDRPCIWSSQRCDGHIDCIGGDDERDCVCSGFECHNGRCLWDFKLVCDGRKDCGDGSDELDCSKYLFLSFATDFWSNIHHRVSALREVSKWLPIIPWTKESQCQSFPNVLSRISCRICSAWVMPFYCNVPLIASEGQ